MDELIFFLGEKATWPRLSMIKNHLKIELTLDEIVYRIRCRRLQESSASYIYATPNPSSLATAGRQTATLAITTSASHDNLTNYLSTSKANSVPLRPKVAKSDVTVEDARMRNLTLRMNGRDSQNRSPIPP